MTFSSQNHAFILNQLQECIKSCGETWQAARGQGLDDTAAKSKKTFENLIDLQQEFQIYTDAIRTADDTMSYEQIVEQANNAKLIQNQILAAQKVQMVQAQERFAKGGGSSKADDGSDEEVQFEGGDITAGLICPITQKLPKRPVVSSTCRHVYDRDAILEYISTNTNYRSRQVECPVAGCQMMISRECIIEDPEITKKIKDVMKNNTQADEYEKL